MKHVAKRVKITLTGHEIDREFEPTVYLYRGVLISGGEVWNFEDHKQGLNEPDYLIFGFETMKKIKEYIDRHIEKNGEVSEKYQVLKGGVLTLVNPPAQEPNDEQPAIVVPEKKVIADLYGLLKENYFSWVDKDEFKLSDQSRFTQFVYNVFTDNDPETARELTGELLGLVEKMNLIGNTFNEETEPAFYKHIKEVMERVNDLADELTQVVKLQITSGQTGIKAQAESINFDKVEVYNGPDYKKKFFEIVKRDRFRSGKIVKSFYQGIGYWEGTKKESRVICQKGTKKECQRVLTKYLDRVYS